jgi:hypothetical protein
MENNNKALVKATENALSATETAALEYGAQTGSLAQMLAEEMDGLDLTFDRIKIPAGGGLAYEVPSDNPDSPDMVKEFKAVILFSHEGRSYFREKYTGATTPPDCASRDGKVGVTHDGEIKTCADCEYNKFGSGENKGKACKRKRVLYILRAGEAFPIILTAPTCSVDDFGVYVRRLLSKAIKPSAVVTKFSLKKAQNAGGIAYSQAVFAVDRLLTPEENAVIAPFAEQVKALAQRIESSFDTVTDGGDE